MCVINFAATWQLLIAITKRRLRHCGFPLVIQNITLSLFLYLRLGLKGSFSDSQLTDSALPDLASESPLRLVQSTLDKSFEAFCWSLDKPSTKDHKQLNSKLSLNFKNTQCQSLNLSIFFPHPVWKTQLSWGWACLPTTRKCYGGPGWVWLTWTNPKAPDVDYTEKSMTSLVKTELCLEEHFHLMEPLGKDSERQNTTTTSWMFGQWFSWSSVGTLEFDVHSSTHRLSPLFFSSLCNTRLSHADEVSWLVSKATCQLFVPAAFCLRVWRSFSPFRPLFPPVIPPTGQTNPLKAHHVLSNIVSMCNPG